MDIGILIQFGGGLGLFMYGMKIMGTGLQKAAGDRMKRFMEVLTSNRLLGVLVGTGVTALIQSSSATTVMVVGFVNAGIMNLAQAAGVIMGANIGTTVTAQLIAFKLTSIAPIAILIGVALILFARNKLYRRIGEILTGFGILFLGMDLMSQAMVPLRNNQGFLNIIAGLENKLIGVLVGFGITAILQSSSVTVGMLQALAMQGLVDINMALPVIFGQNIGTCVTAMLSSIGTSSSAKRAAIIHLLFNAIGTAIFLCIISVTGYESFIVSLSPGSISRQIANAHTIFNIVTTAILLPFAPKLVNMANRIIPAKDKKDEPLLKYLDVRILQSPSIAVIQAVKEVVRMGELAQQNFVKAYRAFIERDEALIHEVMEREKVLNFLNREITKYLVNISNLPLNFEESKVITGIYHSVIDFERIGDHAENLTELAEYRIENNLVFSDKAVEELNDMYERVNAIVGDSIKALKDSDKKLAATIEPRETEIDTLEETLRNSHIERLNNQQCLPASGVIFLDLVNNLERIADHASNVAYTVLD